MTGTTTDTTAQSGADAGNTSVVRPPTREGAITHDAFGRLDAAEQGRYAQLKRTDGDGGEYVLRDSLPVDSGDDEPGDEPAATDAIDPAKMQPGEKIKLVGKDGVDFELDAADVARLMEAHAAEALRKTQVPADANAYEPKLPDTFKPPAGVELTIDNTDPALFDLKNWAHKRGLSQSEFSDVLGIYAAREAKQAAAINAAAAKQVELLGTTGAQRVDAVSQFLRGMLGDDLARPVLNTMVTAKHVQAFERLMQRVASQGSASFSQSHRVPSEPPGRVSQEEYDRMTPAQRWEYSRSHDQSQFQKSRHGQGGEIR